MAKRIVYTNGEFHVELRESGYFVIKTKTCRVQHVYFSLADAKRWFFAMGL